MSVRIALCSREDNTRPTDGSVRHDAIASTHGALRSSGAGSSWSQKPENLSFPITGRENYESHRNDAEAADAAAWAAAEEEALRARIVKKRQRRNMRALAREQNRSTEGGEGGQR